MAENNKRPSLHFGNMYKEDKYTFWRIKKYSDIIRPHLKSGSKILDIGCYTADILELLPKDIIYYGVEFDDEAAKIAQQRGARILKIDLDCEALDMEEQFDVIIAAEVLEHLKSPYSIVKSMQGLLRDDGLAVISLPNENTFYHRLMSLSGIGIDMCVFQDFKHLHLPTIRQSENFLTQNFDILQKYYYINPGAKGSRIEKMGCLFKLVPEFIWYALAKWLPGLFARGTIFVCTKKTEKRSIVF